MPETGNPRAAQPLGLKPKPASERVALARLALEAALATPGVAAAVPGPLGMWVTHGEGEHVPGVVAAALADGGYGLTVHLAVEPEPLHELAERVRARVAGAVKKAGLAGLLGPIDVSIEDVVASGSEAGR